MQIILLTFLITKCEMTFIAPIKTHEARQLLLTAPSTFSRFINAFVYRADKKSE
jgi:hypothetical protein